MDSSTTSPSPFDWLFLPARLKRTMGWTDGCVSSTLEGVQSDLARQGTVYIHVTPINMRYAAGILLRCPVSKVSCI